MKKTVSIAQPKKPVAVVETTFDGQLQVDHAKGTIWFNSNHGVCRFRITGLSPIPPFDEGENQMVDIWVEKP